MNTVESVAAEVVDGTLVLRLNRPDVLNALNLEMFETLVQQFDRADRDPEIRSVVLHGAGRAFCAGDDLRGMGMIDGKESTLSQELELGHPRLIRAMRSCGKPIIAALHGWVLGAGCEVALSADIRVGDPTVRLGIPYIKRAMAGGAAVIVEIFGVSMASDLLLTGRTLDLAELRTLGAVQREAPEGGSLEAALALAQEMHGLSGPTLALTKATLTEHWNGTVRPRVAIDNFVAMVSAQGEDQTREVNRFLGR